MMRYLPGLFSLGMMDRQCLEWAHDVLYLLLREWAFISAFAEFMFNGFLKDVMVH
jgi:hypothetical protein